ncbi:MAG: SDR family NAD(P)-dependent oxidoreductase [Gammaproteobacteria bacterium]|jgi:3-oxoacyl-[acyl-carrier protein] reductase
MDRERFSNRVALITGAGSETGIGFATACNLGRSGARIAITSTTARIDERVAALQAEGIDARGYVADLTDRKQVDALIGNVQRDFGAVDILVNNAGMTQVGQEEPLLSLADMTPETWDESIDRNLGTCFNVTHRVLPGMITRGYGRIVNVSSVTGPLVSNPGEAAYSAAKAAMVGMSRSLAIEVAAHGITVNNVAPGWIASGSQTAEEAVGAQNTPMKRAGTPAEVADLIAFLASDEATYITGQLHVIDGGNILQEYKGPGEQYY